MKPSKRHIEVLETALVLISERGYAGGSLRELARRLNISQPSLYTYFKTKEELVEQIIRYCGFPYFANIPPITFPAGLPDLPDYVRHVVLHIYQNPLHPVFVRFMFVITVEKPRFREILRTMFSEMARAGMQGFIEPLIRNDEMTVEEGGFLVRLITNALALSLIEERVLFGDDDPSDELGRFGDFIVEVAETFVASRR